MNEIFRRRSTKQKTPKLAFLQEDSILEEAEEVPKNIEFKKFKGKTPKLIVSHELADLPRKRSSVKVIERKVPKTTFKTYKVVITLEREFFKIELWSDNGENLECSDSMLQLDFTSKKGQTNLSYTAYELEDDSDLCKLHHFLLRIDYTWSVPTKIISRLYDVFLKSYQAFSANQLK